MPFDPHIRFARRLHAFAAVPAMHRATRAIARTAAAIAQLALLAAIATGATAADFDGDGRQDLVWRDHAGRAVVWRMLGLSVGSRSTLPQALDAGSTIVGSGNFFGSAPGAIAWVDSQSRLALWRVSNGTVQQQCTVASGIDASWQFLGIGDLDGNGTDDVAWRGANGEVIAFLMNGCATPQPVTLAATADADWSFLGIGKVDTHTDAALFWRDSTGNVQMWRLHNGNGVLPTTLQAGAYATWDFGALGDIDGDGWTDLVWRNGNTTAAWLVHGTKFDAVPITPASTSVFAVTDTIFAGNFDQASAPAPPLDAAWSILGTGDVDGDGRADLVLADDLGRVALWRMQGGTVAATGLIAPVGDMPYTLGTGWRMPLDRPTVTKTAGNVTVAWNGIGGTPLYTVYASADNFPAASGVAIVTPDAQLGFARNAPGYADKRYFAVSARYLGIDLPPSAEAWIAEFVPHLIAEWGAMAIADIDGDGCVDVLDAFGDCNGNFTVLNETTMGLAALRAPGRKYRDVVYADFDNDGIMDLVANVYSDLGDDASHALLFHGLGNRQFAEDPAFSALDIRGYGETIVVADFNNDGYLDIFLPHYSMDSPDEHSWLLLNDGSGHFADVSDLTGMPGDPDANLALRAVPKNCRVEGAQAADVDGDGRIDLYVASHLFLNQYDDGDGVPHFLDAGPRLEPSSFMVGTYPYYACTITTPSPIGLPVLHDEGAKIFDFDNSGNLSLLIDGAESVEAGGLGVGIYTIDGLGNAIDHSDAVPHFYMYSAWGVHTADVDGDGRQDILLIGGCDASFVPTPENPNCAMDGNPHVPPHLLLNRGGQFVPNDFWQDGLDPTQVTWWDSPASADFNLDGTPDFALRSTSLVPFINQAQSFDTIVVSVVGPNGETNQAGRVVRVTPQLRPATVMTQVVDGGSGYLASSQYDLTFATPYPGAYTVSVRFAGATYTATARRGDHVTMRSNGTYSVQ